MSFAVAERAPLSPLAPFRVAEKLGLVGAEAARIGLNSLDWGRTFAPPYLEARSAAAELHRSARALCDAHGLSIRVSGPIPRSPVIVVANHVTYLDPLVIAREVPVAALAKREVSEWPVVGASLKSLGVLFVSRGDAASGAAALRRMSRLLSRGVSVLNFAEGTTTRGDTVRAFHRGVFGLARLTRVPVVPVRLDYDREDCSWVGDDAFVPHYLALAARPRVEVRVRFGAPLVPDDFPSADSFARLCRFLILHELREKNA
jgi:1-acyl-sn-glycerol-3-phosphate acyltransferase